MPALPLWSDAAAFGAAFLQLPQAPPWAWAPQSRWPHLAAAPPGLAEALLSPPPWPPVRHPLGPFQVAAALRVHHARAAAAQAQARSTHAQAFAAHAPPPPSPRQGAARVYSRQQLLALKPASTPRPPELEGHPAALDDAPLVKAVPPVPAAVPSSAAAAAPPGPPRHCYSAAVLLRMRHAVATPPSPAVLAAAAELQGVTQPAAAAPPPLPAAAPGTGADAPLPPLLPPAGLWSEGEDAAEGPAWTESAYLDDVAALPSAAAALAPPPPAWSHVALRFSAALPAFCARACSDEDAAAAADADDAGQDGLRWALLRSSPSRAAAEPATPPLVTALQLLPRCDAAAALAALLDAANAADAADAPVVGWAAVTFGTGAFLPAAVRAAFAARPPDGPGGQHTAAVLPFACVDALRGAHGPPCVECYDMRSGAPLPFQLTHAA